MNGEDLGLGREVKSVLFPGGSFLPCIRFELRVRGGRSSAGDENKIYFGSNRIKYHDSEKI